MDRWRKKICIVLWRDNVAYIDFEKCRLCRKCEAVCPTGAIHAVNFPPRPQKPAEPKPAPAPVAAQADAKAVEPNVEKEVKA